MNKIIEVWKESINLFKEIEMNNLSEKFEGELFKYKNSLIQAPVLGSMKAGKSSMLNRLLKLGDNKILPLDVLQATGKPVYISYQPSFYQSLTNTETGDLSLVDYEEWVSLIKGEQVLGANIKLEMGLDLDILKKTGLLLIDTPGINTPTEEYFDITWSSVVDSKLAIYVIDSRQIISDSDLQFIRLVKNYAGDFIFVLSRFDQLPGSPENWQEEFVVKQVKYLRNKLKELNIEALEICPISSSIESYKDSGFENLENVICNLIDTKKEDVLVKSVLKRMINILYDLNKEFISKKKLLEKTQQLDEKSFINKCSEIEARIIESQHEKKSGERNLSNKIETLKFDILNQFTDISNETCNKIKNSIFPIQTIDKLDNFSQIELRAEIDNWRNENSKLIENSISRISDFISDASDEWMNIISKNINDIFNDEINFTSYSIDLDKDSLLIDNKQGNIEDLIEELENQRQQIKSQLEKMESEIENVPNKSEVKQEIKYLQNQMSQINYDPSYQTITQDNGARIVKTGFRLAGKASDIALMLTPLPVGKLKPLLKGLPAAEKILNGVKTYNKIIGNKNRILKKVIKPFSMVGNFIDVLNVEYWSDKLGEKIGQTLMPDTIIQIEDAEVKKLYLESIKPYEDDIHRLNIELSTLDHRSLVLENNINFAQLSDGNLENRINELKSSKKEDDQQMVKKLNSLRLIKRKEQIIQTLTSQLLDREGKGWNAQLRKNTIDLFVNLSIKALNEFNHQVKQKESELRLTLDNLKNTYKTDKESTEKELKLYDYKCEKISELSEKLTRI